MYTRAYNKIKKSIIILYIYMDNMYIFSVLFYGKIHIECRNRFWNEKIKKQKTKLENRVRTTDRPASIMHYY